MLIRNRRWVFLSSSALAIACCLASGAQSQTTSEPAPAPTPAPTPAPAPTPPAAQTPPAPTPTPTPAAEAPQTPTISVPPVTVTAPPPPRRPGPARPAQAAPARVTPAPATPPVTPTTTPRASTQPYAPLGTITSGQIQQTPTQNFGDVFFTQPGATSSTFAPGTSRPIVRGLDNYRVRIQENGLATNDVSDLSEDHAVPIDPLAPANRSLSAGPRRCVTARRPPAASSMSTTTGSRPYPVGAASRANLRRALIGRPRDREIGFCSTPATETSRCMRSVRPPRRRLQDPDLSVSVSARSGAAGRRQAAEFVRAPQRLFGRRLFALRPGIFRRRGLGFNSLYGIPGIEASERATNIDLTQRKITTKGEFRPGAGAIDAIRFWGGTSTTGISRSRTKAASTDPADLHQPRARRQRRGAACCRCRPSIRAAHHRARRAGEQQRLAPSSAGAASLFDPNRTTSVAAYMFNEFRFNEAFRMQAAGRIEQVHVDGMATAFRPTSSAAARDPTASDASLNFAPKSALGRLPA